MKLLLIVSLLLYCSLTFLGLTFGDVDHSSFSFSATLLSIAPLLSVGSSDAEASDEVEADDNVVLNSPRTYIVNSLFTKQLIGIYSTQRDLLAASDILLGEALTHRRLINIIGNGGIIHTVKGSFIISVTGPSS